MKLFVKILLVVLISFVGTIKVASANLTFTDIQEPTTSYSFHREISEIDFKDIKNDLVNCCQNGQDLVDYRNWSTGVGSCR
jgi:hypothetical protein